MLTLFHSPQSRSSAIMVLIEEMGIADRIEARQVSIPRIDGTGHRDPANPHPEGKVPALEIEGEVLTEGPAILQFLGDRAVNLSLAPKAGTLARARVNEVMDFFNTYLMRDYVYGLVYSRVLAHYRLPGPAQQQFIALHEPRAAKRLKALDTWIGSKTFICGNEITIADYFGSGIVSAGELVAYDLRAFANVTRWMNTMKSLPTWDEVHAGFYGWRSAVEAQMKASA